MSYLLLATSLATAVAATLALVVLRRNLKSFRSVSRSRCMAFRLGPGQELKSGIVEFVQEKQIRAGVIVTCVGSVRTARIRLAGASRTETNARGEVVAIAAAMEEEMEVASKHEILALVGTVSTQGSHLHITLGNEFGQVIGGHFMGDAIINTTAEIVIMDCAGDGFIFTREFDPSTGYPELVVKPQ